MNKCDEADQSECRVGHAEGSRWSERGAEVRNRCDRITGGTLANEYDQRAGSPSNRDHRHPHPERRTVEGLPQQGGCGVFRSRRDRSQHGGDEQVDQREGVRKTLEVTILKNGQSDLSLYGDHEHLCIQLSCKFIIGEFKVMQISMDVKLLISEVDRYQELELTNIHLSTQQSTTRVRALMAHHTALMSHHMVNTYSAPVLPKAKRLWVAHQQHT